MFRITPKIIHDQTKLKFILISFLVIFTCMEIFALNIESHYKFDIPMCALLLVLMYRFRESFYLLWTHYMFFSIFLWVHCLGMYGLYSSYPLGVEYDYLVHGYFGFIFALFMLRWLNMSSVPPIKKSALTISVLIAVLGISAAHELYEYAGAVLLGSGEGVLFIGAGDHDQWDTQKDMLNNVIGGVMGVFTSRVFNLDEVAIDKEQHE